MVAGTVLLTSNDAITKWLLTSLHPGDIMAWRGLLSLPIVLLILRSEGARLQSLKPRKPVMTGLRACFALVTSVLVVISFQVLPLADALPRIFVSPLRITALAALIRKEPVGWRRWAATRKGWAGALRDRRSQLRAQSESGCWPQSGRLSAPRCATSPPDRSANRNPGRRSCSGPC